MTITITRRSRIVFDDPNVGRRVGPKLKSRGFRWSGKQGVWYSKRPRAREVATEILGVTKLAKSLRLRVRIGRNHGTTSHGR